MKERDYKKWILGVTILVPLVIVLIAISPKSNVLGEYISMLPPFHATVNALTVCTLFAALISIKKGNVSLHKLFNLISLGLGCLFLLSYILYHSGAPSVVYGDINHDGIVDEIEKDLVGTSRIIYLVVLASHILLSIGVVPLVLLALYSAMNDQWIRHKKIVKFAFPIWVYVSITGVVVYFLIKPYYL